MWGDLGEESPHSAQDRAYRKPAAKSSICTARSRVGPDRYRSSEIQHFGQGFGQV